MRLGHCLIFLLGLSGALTQTIPATERPTESRHRQGPDGLEGWTLNYALPGHGSDRYPKTLVLARRGHIIRHIAGEPFVWRWIFWAGGRQIAYETGPLHFGMQCNLSDVTTGRKLATFDCFHGLPADAPQWEKALESRP